AIRRAYRDLAVQWHPDKNPAPEATARFQAISHSYAALTADPDDVSDGDDDFDDDFDDLARYMDLFNDLFAYSSFVFGPAPRFFFEDGAFAAGDTDDDLAFDDEYGDDDDNDDFIVNPTTPSQEGVRVVDVDDKSATVDWRHMMAPDATYRLEVSSPMAGLAWALAYIGTATRYRVRQLQPGTEYEIRIAVQVDDVWSPWSAVLRATTTGTTGRKRHPHIQSNVEIQFAAESAPRNKKQRPRRKPKKRPTKQKPVREGGPATVATPPPAADVADDDDDERQRRLAEQIAYELELERRAEEIERERAEVERRLLDEYARAMADRDSVHAQGPRNVRPAPRGARDSAPRANRPPSSTTPCRFFQRGACTAATCRFLHVPGPGRGTHY
ncbi:hypothetical protein PBRA_009195, partial [Plasmodiophora brassicae]